MRQHRGSEVLYEAASKKNKKPYNYRSTNDDVRYAFFAAAVVQELEIIPEGQIRQHTMRIASEISHLGPSQLIVSLSSRLAQESSQKSTARMNNPRDSLRNGTGVEKTLAF